MSKPAVLERESDIESPAKTAHKKAVRDMTATYNAFKTYEGKLYTGAKVGRGQKWRYDAGEWKERKVRPDKWEFTYAVTKRRAGHAPEGSGAPVGTEYHWYVMAHQVVKKLNANDYSTAMSGVKYKLAHKRAGKEDWSAADPAQRRRLAAILEDMLADLKRDPQQEEAPSGFSGDGREAPEEP
jgi:hypothetical protein